MKKIVVFTNLEKESLDKIDLLSRHFDLTKKEVTLIHCYEIHSFINELSFFKFPTDKEVPEIKSTTTAILEQKCKDLGLSNYKVECLFDENPKQKCLSFIEDNKVDISVVFQNPKSILENIFESSFASFLQKYSPSDVLTIK